MRAFDCRAIANFATSRESGRSLVDRIKAMQSRDGILSLSIVHGFPAADVYDVGTRVIAITDGDPGAAEAVASALGQEIIAGLPLRSTARLPPAEAIARGLSFDGGPVVLADRWDNPGGGVGGDNTQMLTALLAWPEVPAAIGAMWDPGAVRLCQAADPGTQLHLRVGGKATPQSGPPLDLIVTVGQTTDDLQVPFEQSRVSLGAAAAVRVGELDVVLASKRVQTFHPQVFTALGIDLGRKKLVAVKSANHFFAAFSKIAPQILYVDCDGPYPSEPKTIPYTQIRRPIWPLDPDPWGAGESQAMRP
jgi:microcystin degradation protein MlrC